ncbi:unnamed protein product [Amoebophrya sp. A120]|nr:unnamed protein product [Amoebophrya sp. A120]|eukprot:GSA120T00011742001.1
MSLKMVVPTCKSFASACALWTLGLIFGIKFHDVFISIPLQSRWRASETSGNAFSRMFKGSGSLAPSGFSSSTGGSPAPSQQSNKIPAGKTTGTASWKTGLVRYFRPTLPWQRYSEQTAEAVFGRGLGSAVERASQWLAAKTAAAGAPLLVFDETVDRDILKPAAEEEKSGAAVDELDAAAVLGFRARLGREVGHSRLAALPRGSLYVFPVTNLRGVALAHRLVELTSAGKPRIPNPQKSDYGLHSVACWVMGETTIGENGLSGGCVVEIRPPEKELATYFQAGTGVVTGLLGQSRSAAAAPNMQLLLQKSEASGIRSTYYPQWRRLEGSSGTASNVAAAPEANIAPAMPDISFGITAGTAAAEPPPAPGAKESSATIASTSATESSTITTTPATSSAPPLPSPQPSSTLSADGSLQLPRDDPTQWAAAASKFWEIAKQTGTDKVSSHRYHELYGKYLPGKFLDPKLRKHILFEIGLGCTMVYGPGKSATLWRKLGFEQVHFLEYFPKCVELYESRIKQEGYHVHVGSQADVRRVEKIKASLQEEAEVVIDDGGHRNYEMITSVFQLWPIVRNGGLYFCEDWSETAYIPGYLDAPARIAEPGGEQPGTAQFTLATLLRHMFCRIVDAPCFGGLVFLEAQYNHVMLRKAL